MSVFEGSPLKNSLTDDAAAITTSAGTINPGYSYHASQMNATAYQGGSVKIMDTGTFPISLTISAALVTINPGAMREMQSAPPRPRRVSNAETLACSWHPSSDEWSFFLSGQGRVTVSSGPAAVRGAPRL